MTDPVVVVRRPRGKGLRSKAAAKRKALLGQPLAPIGVPPDTGPRR